MIPSGLIEALDDCIERLHSGQSIDECLGAYPQLSQVLRPLLEAGVATQQLGPGEIETRLAQAQVWERLQRLQKKETRKESGWKQIGRVLGFAAVLGLVAFGLLFMFQSAASHIQDLTPTIAASDTPTHTITPTPLFTPTPISTATLATSATPTPSDTFTSTVVVAATDSSPSAYPTQTPQPLIVPSQTPFLPPILIRSSSTPTPTHYPTYTHTPYHNSTRTPTPKHYPTYTRTP